MNTIYFRNFLRLLPVCVFIGILNVSCETSFEEPDKKPELEIVNGIQVKWRTQITDNQKSALREILNNLVLVEGDYFAMGASPEQDKYARPNEYPNAYIKLSNYYICKNEVTDTQFNAIMGTKKTSSSSYLSRISLSEWEVFINLIKDLTSVNFNFPSEAQWEFAARGGKLSKGYIFPGSNKVEEVRSTSHVNGSRTPNELGLYNMADLKSEWCLDYYNDLISDKILFDFVQVNGKDHVVRGGNYRCSIESDKYFPKYNSELNYRLGYGTTITQKNMDYRNCRTTSRSYSSDNIYGNDYIGVRLVVNISRNNY